MRPDKIIPPVGADANRLSKAKEDADENSAEGTIRRCHSFTSDEFAESKILASWGGVVQIAQGIGVEVIDPDYGQKCTKDIQSHPYVVFIREQLKKIRLTSIGRDLINAFSTEYLPNARQIDSTKAEHAPYKGIHVLIGEPFKKPLSKKPTENRKVIETFEQSGLVKDGESYLPNGAKTPTIPRICFFNKPVGPVEVKIGETTAIVTGRGIERHKDFPGVVQTFDSVLAHEFVHAYLSQTGIFERLKKVDFSGDNQNLIGNNEGIDDKNADKNADKSIDYVETLEEVIVVGVENRYRIESRQETRTSYKSVHLRGNPIIGGNWNFSINDQEIINALTNGKVLTGPTATYIITGQ